MSIPSSYGVIQSDEILITKIEIPLVGSRIIPRSRLIHQLKNGMNQRLILITAPAGYGKTTLLGEWISTLPAIDWRIAWVTLDAFDDSTLRLWAYIISAIKKIYPKLNFKIEKLFHTLQETQDFTILNPLLNEVAQLPFSLVLILDDYQELTDETIHRSIGYLIERLPANMHVVISSRTLPPIPLSRLRTQQYLLELNSNDLAFTPSEVEKFFLKVMNLSLDPDQLVWLTSTTQGWIAGLKLAAISIESHPQWNTMLPPVNGSNRQIFDYFAEEVFNQLPDQIQDFLLLTSVLSGFSVSLCNFLLERTDSHVLLEQVEQANLFIVCLDVKGEWYKYHPLFAEFLRQHLQQTNPDKLVKIHRKAYKWFLDNGFIEQAISHVLEAGDFEIAAQVLDSCTIQALIKFDNINVIRWINIFSDEIICRKPRLGICYAMANYHFGRADVMEAKLQIVKEYLEQSSKSQNISEDNDILAWQLLVMQTAVEFLKGDFEKGISQLLGTMDTAPQNDPFFWGFANHILAAAYELVGDSESAVEYYEKGCQFAFAHNLVPDYSVSRCRVAKIRKSQGQLREACREFEQSIDYVNHFGQQFQRNFEPRIGLMEIAIERHELEKIEAWIPDIIDHLQTMEDITFRSYYYEVLTIGLTRYFLARRDFEQAFNFLQIAAKSIRTQHYRFEHPVPEIIDLQMQYWTLSGELQNKSRPFKKEISAFRSYDHPLSAEQAAFARIDLAQGNIEDGLRNLSDLEVISRQSKNLERLLEVQILKASAYQTLGQTIPAIQALDEAIKLAVPEGYVRVFIHEGLSMKNLLVTYLAYKDGIDFVDGDGQCKDYARKLLSIVDHDLGMGENSHHIEPREIETIWPAIEPLSSREMEVLEMLVAGKTRKDIVTAMTLSVNTVKTHIKNIYRKLNAHDRKTLLQNAQRIKLGGNILGDKLTRKPNQ